MSLITRLHLQTVTPFMFQTLKAFMEHPALESFQLAGGTSIALLTGHRQSIDLDLFTDRQFDWTAIAEAIAPFSPLSEKQSRIGVAYQLPATLDASSLKVDLCNWRTPFLHAPVVIDGLRLTDLRDSCADKLNAITDRNELKDIWDISELLKYYSLTEMIGFYRQKHPFLNAREPIRAIQQFDYNQPVSFRIYNGETLASTRQRIETGLSQLLNKSVAEKPLNIPEEYRRKLAQKGAEMPKPTDPLKRPKRPRL